MSNEGPIDKEMATEAFTALRKGDAGRATTLLGEVVRRYAVRSKDKIANDAA